MTEWQRNVTWYPFHLHNLSLLHIHEFSWMDINYRQNHYAFWRTYYPTLSAKLPSKSKFLLTFTGSTLGTVYNELKDAKETARCKQVLVVTELFNFAVNDFNAKKSAHYSQVLVVTELAVSGADCKLFHSIFSNDDTRSDPTPSGGGTGGHVGHHRRRHIYTFRYRCFGNNLMETVQKDILALVKTPQYCDQAVYVRKC